ncbi:hypothetical protein JCM10213_000428 [Rhodosporidiobolus nylandii]
MFSPSAVADDNGFIDVAPHDETQFALVKVLDQRDVRIACAQSAGAVHRASQQLVAELRRGGELSDAHATAVSAFVTEAKRAAPRIAASIERGGIPSGPPDGQVSITRHRLRGMEDKTALLADEAVRLDRRAAFYRSEGDDRVAELRAGVRAGLDEIRRQARDPAGNRAALVERLLGACDAVDAACESLGHP